MESSIIPYLSTIQDQTQFIDSISTKYTHIYVSIGGKFNESTIQFNYPKNRHIRSNSIYQLVPEFLKNLVDEHVLILILDDFTNDENRNINIRLLTPFSSTTLDIALFHTHISIKNQGTLSTDSLIESILDLAKKMEISPKNTMFCNYIVFYHPNQQEYNLEEAIQVQMQKIFDRPANVKFSDCFYQWHGATFYFYNLIYRYKKYATMRLVFTSELIHLCDSMNFNRHIDKNDVSKLIEDITLSDIHQKKLYSLRKLHLFNINNIDITSPIR